MLIAQLTDLHLTEESGRAQSLVNTNEHFDKVVESLNALDVKPDVILITGDIADDAHPQAYAKLRSRIADLPAPCFMVPGNHDDQALLRACFPDHPGMTGDPHDPINFAIDTYDVRLIGLDSTIRGSHCGFLCKTRLEWLEQCLASQPDRKTLIFMHHPPFNTGLAEMDAYSLRGRSRTHFAELVVSHPQVVRIICGHVHRPIHTLFAGVPTSIAPSIAFSQVLSLNTLNRPGMTLDASKYELHLWTGTSFVSHVVSLEKQSGAIPYPDSAPKSSVQVAR
jgi:3',5'-cyclic AMP phosphodiesterase CpdA